MAFGWGRVAEAATATFTLITREHAVGIQLPEPDGCRFEYQSKYESPWISAKGTSGGSGRAILLGGTATYRVTITGFHFSCKAKMSLDCGGRTATIAFSTKGGPVSFGKQTIQDGSNGKLITILDDNTIQVD